MRLEAQVLGTGAEGHVASVVVSTEKSRVLFNVGEGTQRLAGEHGLRLSRSLDAICLTRLTWHHIGGLQGNARQHTSHPAHADILFLFF
jgi:ribonuclease Z